MATEKHQTNAFKKYAVFDTSRRGINITNRVRVICNQTGKIFRSITEAADDVKVSHTKMSLHLKNAEKYPSINSLTFSIFNG